MKWAQHEIDGIVANYAIGGLTECVKVCNRSERAIRIKLSRLGILNKRSIYQESINHDFFQVWSSTMAYILGFVTADGCVYKKGGHEELRITLQARDICILEYIRGKIAPQQLIRTYSHTNKSTGHNHLACCISVTSKKIVSDLSKFGVVQRKTGQEIIPIMPPEFFQDWLRGLFDGDGCWYSRIHNGYITYGANITSGCVSFLNELKEKIRIGHVRKTSAWQLAIDRKQELNTLYNLLYKENGQFHNRFCLQRKKQKIDPLLNDRT